MNKKVVVAVVGILAIVAAAIMYVALLPNKGAVIEEMTSEATPQTTAEAASPQSTDAPGSYQDYSEAAVQSTTGTKLLFFHAPWCPQCRAVEASIKEEGLPAGVTVFKVDYDSNQKLRQKYGVTIQTTFVKIDDNGNKIDSYVAYEEPRFSSVARELLP